MYLGPGKVVEAMIAPSIALLASILAFAMRREAIAFLGIYLTLWLLLMWGAKSWLPGMAIVLQSTLNLSVLAYLLWLWRLGRLR